MEENYSDLIGRYINGLVDENEKDKVESLFLKGEDNSGLHQLLENDWNEMLKDASPQEVSLSHLLDKVHHIIRKKEILQSLNPLQKFYRLYMKVAAVLLIPILISGGLVYGYLNRASVTSADKQVNSTIYAPLGARISFSLPDGTSGMLNSGSYLSYSLPFNSNREVKLEGEAWFEVKRDENHPFEINAGNSTVKVLGTSFNLSAYPAENYVEVVLNQGKLEFFDNTLVEKVTMLPSERLVYKNGQISKSVEDPIKYNAWTEGKLVFRGDPMGEVARRLERWYNVKVELADSELEKYSFRATFEDDKLEDVLWFLSMTSPIRYKLFPRKFLANGTFEKEKVTIYLKK